MATIYEGLDKDTTVVRSTSRPFVFQFHIHREAGRRGDVQHGLQHRLLDVVISSAVALIRFSLFGGQ